MRRTGGAMIRPPRPARLALLAVPALLGTPTGPGPAAALDAREPPPAATGPGPAVTAPPAPGVDRAAEPPGLLLEGVEVIGRPGVPGPIVVYGGGARALVLGRLSAGVMAPVAAVTEWEGGRAAALGHTGYFSAETLADRDTGRLVLNLIRWVGRRGEGPVRVGIVGAPGLAAWLKDRGGAVHGEVLGEGWERALEGVDVLALGQGPLRAAQVQRVRRFLREGGGVVCAGLGWGWLQLNPGRTLEEHPLNRVLDGTGLAFGEGTLDATTAAGARAGFVARADDPLLGLASAERALDLLETAAGADDRAERARRLQAAGIVTLALQTLPDHDGVLRPRVAALRAERGERLVPRPDRPLDASRALERVLLAEQVRELERLPPDQVRAHPAAAVFPGAVPEGAPRVRVTETIRAARPGWHSLGAYAAPGEVVTLRLEGPAPAGVRLQIGAHTDRLWHLDRWRRVPSIVSSWAVPAGAAEVRGAGAFGGLVYVVIPEEAARGADGSSRFTATVSGVVPAPRYTLGRTDADEWRVQRSRPGPWAELETEKLVLTVPSGVIRGLDDPASLMRFWDAVMDAQADLATIPRERRRPERIVADEQISAGYMHAGYPIMTHLDAARFMTTLADLRRGVNAWGLFHELGHNHQSPDWTFGGTVEVTVNLFTLYTLETLCTLADGARGHPGVDRPPNGLRAYLAAPDFEAWKRDPFLALWMYVQLREAFGWQAFKDVFAEYRALKPEERPSSDAAKRDQWLVRFSRRVGRNLGPFFQAWGVPTSEAARASIADLPVWMPPEMVPERGSGGPGGPP
jgi:hypothetical protein